MKKVKVNLTDKAILGFLKGYFKQCFNSYLMGLALLYFIGTTAIFLFGIFNIADFAFVNIPTWIYLAISMTIYGLKRGGVTTKMKVKLISLIPKALR